MPQDSNYSLTWDLDSLLPHPETDAFRDLFAQFREDLTKLAERTDQLPAVGNDPTAVSTWVQFLKDYEGVNGRARDLNSFIGCHAAADANNKHFQRLEGQLSALEPFRERIETAVEFAMKQTDAAALDAFVQADDFLEEIAFALQDARENARLRLPKEQEQIASELAVDGIHAWGRLYDRLSGELRITVMERGELVRKSPGQVQFDSPQRSVRENNFFAAEKAWRTIADTCADALNHISGTRLTRYRHLGLEDHLDAPLRYNRMQRETLGAMWSTIEARKPVVAKYLKAKARLLGLEKLAWYDQQAPLPERVVADAGGELAYDDACEMVVDSFAGFTADLGDFACQALNGRWIEAENRSGKRQGGFCTGFPTKKQSRIFMTFTDSPDSMSTLAHELGHAYHSYILRDRPLFLRDYPMNLAETASTFAEAVLGEKRLQVCETAGGKLAILDGMLADSVAFLMNIHARFVFEDNFHRERAAGEVSADRLTELMLSAQKEAYLDALADDGWNPTFWISKLHFYISTLPFYNFPYTFGYLLSLGLYALAADDEAAFAGRYRDLLIATGCMTSEEAVRSTFGHDLSQPGFWNRSLDVVEQRVDAFVELVAEVEG